MRDEVDSTIFYYCTFHIIYYCASIQLTLSYSQHIYTFPYYLSLLLYLYCRVSEIISRMSSADPGSGSAMWMEVDSSNAAMHDVAASLNMTSESGPLHTVTFNENDDFELTKR